MAIEPGSRVHPKTRCPSGNDQRGCCLHRIVGLPFPEGIQDCHRPSSTPMVAERAHRRSAEAPERGRYVVIGDRHCDRVRRSKPFFEGVSKGCRRFPTRLAAGSRSAIDFECTKASRRSSKEWQIHQFSFWPMRCTSGERSGNSVERCPPGGDTTGKTDENLQHLSTANHRIEWNAPG